MFVDEARLSARIDHPNVVRVEALKEHKGSYCLLMEFIHGCSLSQLMSVLKKRKTRFSPELAVAIAVRVADGLHAAHELFNPDGTPAGVVHRDVSPANVLISYRGEVKLIDFGIAKATQRLHQTEAAGLKGKIAYMSPEQAFGRDVDRRTDVYALGIMLWEMLAMRRLFRADNDLLLLDMVRDPKILPPRAIVPDLPASLEKVILEALSADRERRPATARDLRYRLLDALPAAATVDPLQISSVVCDVMADKIQEDREMFSISSFNALSTPAQHDSVTISRLLRPVHTGVDIAAELGVDADQLARALPAAVARAEPPTVLPHHEASRPRSALPAFLAAAAVLGLFFGGGTAVAVSVFGAGEPPITATELSAGVPENVEEPAGTGDALDPPEAVPGNTVETAIPGPAPVPATPVAQPEVAPAEPVLPSAAAEAPATEPVARSRRRIRRRRRRPPQSSARIAVDPPASIPEPVSTGGRHRRGSGDRGLAGEARF